MNKLVLLLVAACSAAPVQQEAPTDALASRLKASIVKMQKRVKLGVLPLTDSSGDAYVLGEYLAENLVTALAGADGYDVIERSRLDQVLKESELSASNLLRDDAVISVGKLLGADALVIGTFTVFGEEVAVNCRLVDVTTGRILGTAHTQLPRAQYAELLSKKHAPEQRRKHKQVESTPPPAETPVVVASGAFRKGDRVEISWRGTWYQGAILDLNASQYFIHYDGYADSWNEWVGTDRLRAVGGAKPAGRSVEVLWNGKWYPAEVRETRGDQNKIHYSGYSDSWDEWVGPERIRRQ